MTAMFHTLKVAEVRQEIADAISIRLAVPAELDGQFAFAPGQHLTLRAMIDGEDVRRNYSICSAPHDGELRVAIKKIAGGVFSTWANDNIAVGQSLDVMPPHGSFTWGFAADRTATYAGFAGGSGITPILSMIKTALQAESNSRFLLFYGNRNSHSVMFLEEIAGLKNRYLDRFMVHHFLEDEDGEFELLNGRLDQAKVADLLSSIFEPSGIDAAFVCGPGPMMDAVENALREAGMPQARILIERFHVGELSTARREAARALEQAAEGRSIRVNIDGRRRVLKYSAERGSILDNARAEGLPAPFACKAGVCATCRAKVLNGRVEMIRNFGLNENDLASGYVLACQAVPLTDDVELDFDA